VFTGERKGPLSGSAVRKITARAGEAAGLGFPVHPHMLRHAAGYKLANDGQDTRAIQHYLGHRNITHTVRYTELSPERFKFESVPLTCTFWYGSLLLAPVRKNKDTRLEESDSILPTT
jgi:integrase